MTEAGPPVPGLIYLPPYSPDLNLFEQALAKLKSLIRGAEAGIKEALWTTIGQLIDRFKPAKSRNFLTNSGYEFTCSQNGLMIPALAPPARDALEHPRPRLCHSSGISLRHARAAEPWANRKSDRWQGWPESDAPIRQVAGHKLRYAVGALACEMRPISLRTSPCGSIPI